MQNLSLSSRNQFVVRLPFSSSNGIYNYRWVNGRYFSTYQQQPKFILFNRAICSTTFTHSHSIVCQVSHVCCFSHRIVQMRPNCSYLNDSKVRVQMIRLLCLLLLCVQYYAVIAEESYVIPIQVQTIINGDRNVYDKQSTPTQELGSFVEKCIDKGVSSIVDSISRNTLILQMFLQPSIWRCISRDYHRFELNQWSVSVVDFVIFLLLRIFNWTFTSNSTGTIDDCHTTSHIEYWYATRRFSIRYGIPTFSKWLMWFRVMFSFANARTASFHNVTQPNFVIWIQPDGAILYDSRFVSSRSLLLFVSECHSLLFV